jgi:glycosyltransferase involved in cell wall biosynthesis
MHAPPVSIIILTHNEEVNVAECLDSVAAFDDVHVLDSGSTDRTLEIAKLRGVNVHHHPFQGFGQQRNWAIDHIPTRYDWQFHLDADERMTPALASEVASHSASDPPCGGYQIPSKLMFAGRWLKYAGQYPGYQLRFFHKRRLRFIDYGHGQREVTEHSVGRLREPLVHLGFSKGLDEWFCKHVRYARREAEQAFVLNTNGVRDRLWNGDNLSRRRALKHLAMRLPGRYFLRLAYMLLWRRALCDGWPGVTYSHMVATYEGMIDVYLRVLKRDIDPDHLNAPPDR